MYQNKRLVIIGRSRESIDRLTRLLEGAGYIVTSTTDDGVAIDMVGSSEYAALLIDSDVSLADRRYVAAQARNRDSESGRPHHHQPQVCLDPAHPGPPRLGPATARRRSCSWGW